MKDRFRKRIEEARRIADKFIPLIPFPPAGGEGGEKEEGEQRMPELNKLYNMDCMQGMKEFPDGFFDFAIVDPPYGIGIDGQKSAYAAIRSITGKSISGKLGQGYSPARILPRIGTRFKSTSDMGRKLLRSVS
ncbi:MAG: hypothetical protein V8Q30_11935 [Acutalibacteraceae bacterium]